MKSEMRFRALQKNSTSRRGALTLLCAAADISRGDKAQQHAARGKGEHSAKGRPGPGACEGGRRPGPGGGHTQPRGSLREAPSGAAMARPRPGGPGRAVGGSPSNRAANGSGGGALTPRGPARCEPCRAVPEPAPPGLPPPPPSPPPPRRRRSRWCSGGPLLLPCRSSPAVTGALRPLARRGRRSRWSRCRAGLCGAASSRCPEG